MFEIDRADWLDAIHARYGRMMVTPVYAAAEILLGETDADAMARSIRRRGSEVGDDVMATTTPADCAEVVDELKRFGFLESGFFGC